MSKRDAKKKAGPAVQEVNGAPEVFSDCENERLRNDLETGLNPSVSSCKKALQ
jgi:hypothetical protein